MDDRRPSRIEEARCRALRAKTALGAGAAAAFLAVGALAWVAHPGSSRSSQATPGSSSAGSSISEDDTGTGYDDDGYYEDEGGFSYGSGSLAPSGGSQPQVRTSVS
ncbi:MAG: hypothetical protein ACXWYS_09590 [Gaiellaceae bacterium]